jgi:phosphate transport system substrate-binding protein
MNSNELTDILISAPKALLRRSILLIGIFSCVVFPGNMTFAAGNGGTLVIGGTGGALGGMKQVARVFQEKHPGITVKFVPSLGSGGGIKAVLAGSLDLALSSRPITDSERGQGATAIEYGRTPFVFAAGQSRKATSLSLPQVARIYAGETQTWPDGTPLRLVLRPASDTDMLFLKAMSPEMDQAVGKALSREGMLVATTDQDNADTLAGVQGAFGATTLAQILSEKRHLNPLPLDNVTPDLKSLASGRYPYSKSFYAITAPASSPAARSFLDFLQSPAGRAILTRTGHLAPARPQ